MFKQGMGHLSPSQIKRIIDLQSDIERVHAYKRQRDLDKRTADTLNFFAKVVSISALIIAAIQLVKE